MNRKKETLADENLYKSQDTVPKHGLMIQGAILQAAVKIHSGPLFSSIVFKCVGPPSQWALVFKYFR